MKPKTRPQIESEVLRFTRNYLKYPELDTRVFPVFPHYSGEKARYVIPPRLTYAFRERPPEDLDFGLFLIDQPGFALYKENASFMVKTGSGENNVQCLAGSPFP